MAYLVLKLLECSLTMTLLSLLFHWGEQRLGLRYSARWRCRVWAVLILGFLLPVKPAPVRPVVQVVGPEMFSAAGTKVLVNETAGRAALLGGSLFVLWAAGAFLSLIVQLNRHFRFMEQAERFSAPISPEILQCAEQAAEELRIRQRPEVRQLSWIASPMMAGYRRPLIFLPDQEYDKETLRLVLKHELVHFKRHDLWFKMIILIASAVHWFNPLFGRIRKMAEETCELACDECVVSSEDFAARKCYCEVMLRTVRGQMEMRTALSTGFDGGKESLKKRLEAALDRNRRRKYGGVLIGALALVLVSGGIVGRDVWAAENEVQETTYDPSATMYEPTEFWENGDETGYAPWPGEYLSGTYAVETYEEGTYVEVTLPE